MKTKGAKLLITFPFIILIIVSFSCTLPNSADAPVAGNSEYESESSAIDEKCVLNEPANKFIKKLSIDFYPVSITERTILKAYKRLADNHTMSFLALFSNDVVWKMEGMEQTVPFAGTFTGKAGVKDFIDEARNSIVITNLTYRYHLTENNRVNVHFLEEGFVKSTGKKYAMEVAHLWELDERHKITGFQGFNDCFALYSAFIPYGDPAWCIQIHEADYQIPGSTYSNSAEVVQTLYNAFGSGNLPMILDSVTDDMVWIMAGNTTAVPFAGTYQGKLQLQMFFYNLLTNVGYNGPYTEIFYVVDKGRVDVRQYESVYSYSTGRLLTNYILHSITINAGGIITSFRSYNDTYAQQSIFDWE